MANPRARLELSPEMSIRVRGEVQFVRLVLIVNIANELKLIGALPRPRSSFNGPRARSPTRAPVASPSSSSSRLFPLVALPASSPPPSLLSGTLAFWPADGY